MLSRKHKNQETIGAVDQEKIGRRRFLKKSAQMALYVSGAGSILSSPVWLQQLLGTANAKTVAFGGSELAKSAPEARFYMSTIMEGISCSACHREDEELENREIQHGAGIVKCRLCALECMIRPGERGKCQARENVGGILKSLVYGRPVSVHVDPIEKKPLFHFLPGSDALSLATSGCPLSCKFCQNWQISQARPEDFNTRYTPPEAIVKAAIQRSAPVIAFTYNEPTVFTEYLTDIARMARDHNIRSVLISCGFMTKAPLDEMCDVLDAIKIDLKGFSRSFYRQVCGAEIEPVLRSIRQVSRRKVHLELVNLVVPTLNDSDKMMTELCKWVMGELGPDVPLHFTRFHPDYQMHNLPPTPVSTLERAYDIAKDTGLHYPYVGNYPGHPGNHTYCPQCKAPVIKRIGFFVTDINMIDDRCAACNTKITGVFN
jgi:pyruvate formate lyase activating enzyme